MPRSKALSRPHGAQVNSGVRRLLSVRTTAVSVIVALRCTLGVHHVPLARYGLLCTVIPYRIGATINARLAEARLLRVRRYLVE